MNKSISSVSGRSPITLAAGFLGAFIVGSLVVQLLRSQLPTNKPMSSAVDPVISAPSAVWAPLAERDIPIVITGETAQSTAAIQPDVKPLVGSEEATLWAPFGER